MRPLPFAQRTQVGPFGALLVTLVATLLLAPVFKDARLLGVPTLRILATAVLCAGVYALSRHRRRVFAIGLAIALPALVAETGLLLWPGRHLVLVNFVLTLAFLAFLGASLLRAILEQDRVTLDTLFGGICVYLLLGVAWSLTYSVLEYVVPGSFQADGLPLAPLRGPDEFRREELIYFSFVTLTTVGYGDVLARSNPARALAAAEAVAGSLYLAVFIARLVGLHMAQRGRDLDL